VQPALATRAVEVDRIRAPRHIPELDGLRGIAILTVIIYHFQIHGEHGLQRAIHTATSLGWAGVDLFFALSGFLITGILLDTERGPGMFRRFYARRCLRILPLYYAALIFWFWADPAIWGGQQVPGGEQLWYWLHLSNWRTAYFPVTYPAVTHFWSLAIEEQFYLFWPLVVLLCPRRTALWTAIGLIAASVVFRNLPGVQETSREYSNFLYRLTPSRMDTLLVGALAAIAYREPRFRRFAERRWLWVAAVGAAIASACLIAAGSASAFSEWMTRFGYTGIALFCAAMVVGAALHTGSAAPLQKLLRSPVLRGYGKYSYCLYVIHAPILIWRSRVRWIVGGGLMTALLVDAAVMGVMFLAAMASWYGFERFFLNLRARPSRISC
jgi:peptidoglycan/LPS O-acetylase OafA/YrhL